MSREAVTLSVSRILKQLHVSPPILYRPPPMEWQGWFTVGIVLLALAAMIREVAAPDLVLMAALVTLGVVFAKFFRDSMPERVIIVVSTIPIAIFVNALRVGLTGILTYNFGRDVATGFIHEFQGLITFSLAFMLLLAEAQLLARIWPASWRKTAVHA